MTGLARRADGAAWALLLALIVLTPWPLGSRLPWASMIAAGAAIAVAAAWLATSALSGRRLGRHPLYLPIAAFLAWGLMQWALGWTAYAQATLYELVRYASYAAVFALTLQLGGEERRARKLIRTIGAMAIAVGMFGLVQFLTWNGYLYWVYDPPYSGIRFGPFNGRNYFAGYMIAALGPALTLAFTPRRTGAGVKVLTALSALSVLVCLSRAGALALACSLTVVIVLSPARRRDAGIKELSRRQRVRWAVAALLIALAGLALTQQADRVFGRLETVLEPGSEPSVVGRFHLWRDSLTMFADHPVQGFGLNTYGWTLPRYETEPLSQIYMHAHNEYVEMLVETGVIGAAICLWFLVVLFGLAWKRLRAAEGAEWRAVRIAAIASWTGIVVFSIADFPTIIPAIDYTLAVLAALATVAPESP